MGVICGVAGYAAYDRQLGRALEPGESIDAALDCYGETMARINHAPRRSWWRFWR
jgi:hypothetical protein